MKISNQKVAQPQSREPERRSGPIAFTETEPGEGQYQEPLVVSVFGGEGSGKSRMGGTAPGKIGMIPLERKTRQSLLKAASECGTIVVSPDLDLIRAGNPMLVANLPPQCQTEAEHPKATPAFLAKRMQDISREMDLDDDQPMCCQQHYSRWHANRVKSVAFRMAGMDEVRSIYIDFGQLVEDLLFANYGRTDSIMPLERKSMNQEVKDFLNAINHKHLILSHHATEIWKDNKPTKHRKPASSFSKIGHYTSVLVEMVRDTDREIGSGVSGGPDVQEPGRWTLYVRDSQANPACIGDSLVDEDISFDRLGYLVYPETWQ
jgi:hypothetical protein